jgi:hypothetical protein
MTVYVDVIDKNGNVVGYAANDPPPPLPDKIRLTRYEFRSRFTAAEKVAMYDSTDTMIRVFLDDIQAAENINVSEQDTIDGVNYLASNGLIAAGRASEILAPIPQNSHDLPLD